MMLARPTTTTATTASPFVVLLDNHTTTRIGRGKNYAKIKASFFIDTVLEVGAFVSLRDSQRLGVDLEVGRQILLAQNLPALTAAEKVNKFPFCLRLRCWK